MDIRLGSTTERIRASRRGERRDAGIIALTGLSILLCLVAGPSRAEIAFEEVARQSGIDHVGLSWGSAWGDFNADGWPDLWTNNHFSGPGLYVNNGDRTFTNVAPSVFGTATDLKRDTHGAAWADFDNDGDADLVELTGLQTNASNSRHNLYINDGSGRLDEMAGSFGLATPMQRGRGPQWVDVDGDGRLDLVVTTAPAAGGTYLSRLYRQTADGFEDISAQAGFACPEHAEFAALSDLTGDGVMDIICGGFRFPQKIYDPSVMPFVDVTSIAPTTYSVLDAAIADFNNDLRPDMFLTRILGDRSNVAILDRNDVGAVLTVNAFREKGFEFKSHGELNIDITVGGGFVPVFIGQNGWQPAASGCFVLSSDDPAVWGIKPHTTSDSGVYIGYDASRDTWQFYLVGTGWQRLLGRLSSEYPVSDLKTLGFSPQAALPPVLLVNTGGTLVNRTAAAGLDAPAYCSTSAWGDFDNDMDIDLYMVCENSPRDLPNILYENLGNGTFVAVPDAGGADGASAGGLGRNVSVADYDVDGFLDLFVQQGRDEGPVIPWGPLCCGPDLLFRNVGRDRGNTNSWIQLDLVGTVSNRDGIGATVIATAGGRQQLREQNGGMQHGQQRHQRIHFGLGQNPTVDLVIRWPSGIEDRHPGIAAGRLYRVYEDGGIQPVTLGSGQSAIRVADAIAFEGDGAGAAFEVSLFPASDATVEVSYATADGSATAGQDYTAVSGTLVFAPGQTSRVVSVPILDDGLPEGSESFVLELTGVVSGNATITAASATGTIIDDDGVDCGAPTFDPATDKGIFLWKDCATGQWRMRASAGGDCDGVDYTGRIRAESRFDSVLGQSIESHDTLDIDTQLVDYRLRVWNLGIDGIDFSYPAGSSACFELDAPTDVPVRVGPRALPQAVPLDLETLSDCDGAQVPRISIGDATVTEGVGVVARFDVTLSPASAGTIDVAYAIGGGTATAGLDYTCSSGILTFQPGQTLQTLSVPILDDDEVEASETFMVELTGVVSGNATLADATGTGTILDDDTVDCGAPDFDPATEKAAFLWKDCATGQWSLRVTAGGDAAGVAYVGRIRADTPFDSVSGVSIESHDSLDIGADLIEYSLRVWNLGIDGIDFAYPAGCPSACFELDAPADVPVRVGPMALPQTVPFDLTTLSGCE
jgi:hypothetical protein